MTLPKVGLPGGRVLSAHTPGHGPVQEQPTRSQVLASYLPLKIRERRPSDKGLFLKNTDQPADQVTTDESSSSRRPRLALPGSTTSQQGAVSLQVVTAAVQGRVGDADQCKGVASALNDAVVNLAAASGQAIDVRTTQAIALTDTSPEARAQQLSDACKQWAASLEAGLVDCVVVIASGSGQGLAGTLGNAPKHRGLITAFTGHQLSSDLLSSKQLPDVVALPNSTVGDAEAAVLTERTRLVRTKGVPHSFTDSAVAQAVAAYGAKGLAYIKVNPDGLQFPIVKFLAKDLLDRIVSRTGAKPGDLIFFGADKAKIVNDALGALRLKLGHDKGLAEKGWRPLWVVDFPMFEWDGEEKRWSAMHHPFTAPKDGHEDLLASDPARALSKGYDMVLNGWEIGGGSVRIHRAEVQAKVFRALGISEDEARDKFGFLLDNLQYGAPPHGGIAFGLDRMVALMAGAESIRDVIAFPKTQRAQDLLVRAPSPVDEKQLRELGLRLRDPLREAPKT